MNTSEDMFNIFDLGGDVFVAVVRMGDVIVVFGVGFVVGIDIVGLVSFVSFDSFVSCVLDT